MNAFSRRTGLIIGGLFALTVLLRLLAQQIPTRVEKDSFPGVTFAADAIEYSLPGYHILAIVVFLIMLFTKRWWFSLPICFGYFLLHLYSIWLRSQGCYLGGDICPERPIIDKLLDRLYWIDWIAIPVLVALVIIHIIEIARRRKVEP